MYTSVPVHIHIICDEEAQRYLERRLELVQRPRHDVLVRFYRLTWDAMTARIEREGVISTVHAAGVRTSTLLLANNQLTTPQPAS